MQRPDKETTEGTSKVMFMLASGRKATCVVGVRCSGGGLEASRSTRESGTRTSRTVKEHILGIDITPILVLTVYIRLGSGAAPRGTPVGFYFDCSSIFGPLALGDRF